VLGAGPIGLSVISFLKDRAKRLVAADLSESRLEFCKNGLGVDATVTVEPREDLLASLRETLGGGLPDIIFDATGNRDSMLSTFDLVAHGGRIVFVGLFQGEIIFQDPNFHRRELTVMSSRNATAEEFGQVISAMESGAVDTAPWITHRLDFADVPKRFAETVHDHELRKAVIHLDD